jgi:Leucine-rich repeat (LRR) protein
MRFSSSSVVNVAALAALVWTSSHVPGVASQSDVVVVDERAVLLEFYQATGGAAWNKNYGWAENLPNLCDWEGVLCDGDAALDQLYGSSSSSSSGGGSQRRRQKRRNVQEATDDNNAEYVVYGLQIRENFATGRTPSSLWSLPNLAFVDFSHNPHLKVNFVGLQEHQTRLINVRLHETATTSLVGISGASNTLQVLSLIDNPLNVAIPADVLQLSQLTQLHLSDCGLLGSLPKDIARLTLLHELSLYSNALTGTLPDGLASLIHLRQLALARNQFHGTLPEYLNDFILLQQLWLEHNDFTGSVPSLHMAPIIKGVFMEHNSLSGNLPEIFLQGALGGPRDGPILVNLSHNQLGGQVPAHLDQLEELEITWILGDNEWTSVAQVLCDNDNWNMGAIRSNSCAGLLCPPGTFNFGGYRTDESPCQACATNEYYGSTTCFDKNDRSVLVEIFVATQGEKWDRNDNWLEEEDVCTWYGVTCWNEEDVRNGRIRSLSLPNNALVGSLPETLFNMDYAERIDLSRNEVEVPFTSISASTSIKYLNIARTRTSSLDGIQDAHHTFRELYADQTPMSGTIPQELWSATNLWVISLQECDMVGSLSGTALASMVNLEQLYLSGNNLRGSLPDIWGSLTNLEVLALAKNQFTGSLPSSLNMATSLMALTLEDQVTKGGGIKGTLHPYEANPALRTLLLGKNKLEGTVPAALLSSVQPDKPVTVDLSHNLMTGKIPQELTRFERLNLYLESNFITEVDELLCRQEKWMSGSVGAFGCDAILCPPDTMGGRRMYTDSGCQACSSGTAVVGGDDVLYLGQETCALRSDSLTERDMLEMLYANCGGVGWHSKANWMSEASICDWYGIDCDENGSVSSIVLPSNQLVGSFPTDLFTLPSLVHLKLYSNTIYFNFEGIENAKGLKTLLLDDTGLRSLSGIGSARSLTDVNVGFNQLTGPVPEELSRLVNLETLIISSNKFDGFLPYWLRGLAGSLQTLAAANNKLSGPLYDFADFGSLIFLDLSHNQLSGSVPPSLFADADGENKVVADLSDNRLTGAVPADLARLSRLTLQLKNNQISSVDQSLCTVEGWNDFSVESYQCDGILCPAGTYNRLGRQSSDDSPCEPCKGAQFMGTTLCGSSGHSTMHSNLSILGAVATATMGWILFM